MSEQEKLRVPIKGEEKMKIVWLNIKEKMTREWGDRPEWVNQTTNLGIKYLIPDDAKMDGL